MTSSGRSEATDLEAALSEIPQGADGFAIRTISIAVQDGVVVQIDRTEKRRFVRRRPKSDLPGDSAKSPPGSLCLGKPLQPLFSLYLTRRLGVRHREGCFVLAYRFSFLFL